MTLINHNDGIWLTIMMGYGSISISAPTALTKVQVHVHVSRHVDGLENQIPIKSVPETLTLLHISSGLLSMNSLNHSEAPVFSRIYTFYSTEFKLIGKITATEPQSHRTVFIYFEIFKNVVHSLEPSETPSSSASH